MDSHGKLLRRRIAIAAWFILFCYLGLVGRLVYLQLRQGPSLRLKAISLRERDILLPARHGAIRDRTGNLLASDQYSGTVAFDPLAVRPDSDNPKLAAKEEKEFQDGIVHAASLLQVPPSSLAGPLMDARQRLEEKRKRNGSLRYVPIKKDITFSLAEQIRQANLPGFGVVDGYRREYACGADAPQIIGYQSGGLGIAGLEYSCRRWLQGTNGKAVAEVDNRGRAIPNTRQSLVPPIHGLDVYTTLDPNVQHIAMEEARRIQEQCHPESVAIVVVEPTSGDVLALASLPTFDPNPGKRKAIATRAEFERCTACIYEPGSTLKAITLAAALDRGLISPGSYFSCPGSVQIGKRHIYCDSHGGSRAHGSLTPRDILRKSCNVGAVKVGLKLGGKRLMEAEEEFGIFDPLATGLPAEKRGRVGFNRKKEKYPLGDVARIAFGHSITTTPLHVAMAYAAIANGGNLMKPRLITAVKDADGNTKEAWEPTVTRRVLSSHTSAQVKDMLCAVVSEGTGKVAAVRGYQVAGKTGTAQKYPRGSGHVGSFVGFLPASPRATPRAVILVVVDTPQGEYYGASVAAPAFQKVARRLMTYWRVPEDDPEATQFLVASKRRD